MFITLCVFINHVLRSGYTSQHSLLYYKRKNKQSTTTTTKYTQKEAESPATIGRHVDNIDQNFKDEQKTIHGSICIKSKWLNRQIRKQAIWLINHTLLNQLKEKEFVARQKELWENFANNKQRLINILYTSINSHIPTNALRKYRAAVS